jgi:hypothetical protein
MLRPMRIGSAELALAASSHDASAIEMSCKAGRVKLSAIFIAAIECVFKAEFNSTPAGTAKVSILSLAGVNG